MFRIIGDLNSLSTITRMLTDYWPSDVPVVYDEMWERLTDSVPQHATPAEIEHRLKDLRLAIQEFSARANKMVIQPKHLLRCMRFAYFVLNTIRFPNSVRIHLLSQI